MKSLALVILDLTLVQWALGSSWRWTMLGLMAKVCRQFLVKKSIDTIDWHLHSPELNATENLWDAK